MNCARPAWRRILSAPPAGATVQGLPPAAPAFAWPASARRSGLQREFTGGSDIDTDVDCLASDYRIPGAVPTTIYKICATAVWREAERAGGFRGAGADLRDGFIHFSTAAQVAETAAKHFAGATDLTLVAVEADALGGALKWEVSRGGALFPHLYGALPLTAVSWAKPLPLGADRRHVFPELGP
jgi:uncharacterized protein (DUF952 family)